MKLDYSKLTQIFKIAIAEDLGTGDITTRAIFNEYKNAGSYFLVKEDGIIAGLEVIEIFIQKFLNGVTFTKLKNDGSKVYNGDVVAQLNGDIREILSYERIMLNFLQRMSGVATLTKKFVDETRGTRTKILDTRKTVPGFRYLDKLAVKLGGGENHRIGLFDMFLIKDNHIAAAGSIKDAINFCHRYNEKFQTKFLIEVEVKNLDELKQALEFNVDRIMLDNFSIDMIREAVKIVNGKVELEVSGGVKLENIREIAECGVDFISVGALTHSAKALDISLEIE